MATKFMRKILCLILLFFLTSCNSTNEEQNTSTNTEFVESTESTIKHKNTDTLYHKKIKEHVISLAYGNDTIIGTEITYGIIKLDTFEISRIDYSYQQDSTKIILTPPYYGIEYEYKHNKINPYYNDYNPIKFIEVTVTNNFENSNISNYVIIDDQETVVFQESTHILNPLFHIPKKTKVQLIGIAMKGKDYYYSSYEGKFNKEKDVILNYEKLELSDLLIKLEKLGL